MACNPSSEPPVSTPGGQQPSDPTTPQVPNPTPNPHTYLPVGVGGGGAMSGIALSPYNNLWFVGTDMGTLFRSTDLGLSWEAVNHNQVVFSSDLSRAVSPGFSSDGTTVFHASGGVKPKRSLDSGLTFQSITLTLSANEFIRYWFNDSAHEDVIFAATNSGLHRSENNGSTWARISGITENGVGTFIDSKTQTVYHGTTSGIWSSADNGKTFSRFYTASGMSLRQFTGGRDTNGLTLSFADNNGSNACAWASGDSNTINSCGYVWISTSGASFTKTSQYVGDNLKMAENDSKTIYATGGKNWMNQYGTKVFVSADNGSSWSLKLHQYNWDTNPYSPWPQAKIEYSAVALDVGWWDNGYESFEINRRNSSVAAGSGFFFLHSTLNKGENWKAPFTEYKDTGTRAAKKKWSTRGIEVISIYRMKHHPHNSNLLYGASADIGGIVSEDGGATFRVSKAQYNSNYDYAFDPANQNVVYAASGNLHDWPNEWHANAVTSNGGIYRSNDKGLNWTRLTPNDVTYNRQFLSVGYDAIHQTIYAGSHETGIYRSTDNGSTWNIFNTGLPGGNKIIPQIEVDPNNGNVYALLTGDAPTFSNRANTGIYFLDVANGATSWVNLRGTVTYPADADAGYDVWYYPTAFAIDFDHPDTLWLVDYENRSNWLMTGVWKTTNRGATWTRKHQLTHATDVKIDPTDSNKIYASGYHELDGSWGKGGQYHSTDGGTTWTKNNLPALQHNARSVLIDPNDPTKIFYSYFGGGILKGNNPNHL